MWTTSSDLLACFSGTPVRGGVWGVKVDSYSKCGMPMQVYIGIDSVCMCACKKIKTEGGRVLQRSKHTMRKSSKYAALYWPYHRCYGQSTFCVLEIWYHTDMIVNVWWGTRVLGTDDSLCEHEWDEVPQVHGLENAQCTGRRACCWRTHPVYPPPHTEEQVTYSAAPNHIGVKWTHDRLWWCNGRRSGTCVSSARKLYNGTRKGCLITHGCR